MKRLNNLISMLSVLLFTVLFLSGCTTGGGLIPLTDTMVSETGEVVEKVAGYTADASVAKEHEVHDTLRNRDAMIAKAQAKSGFKLEWQPVDETVFYPGMAEPITVKKSMPKVSYTEPAEFNQALPTEPSQHPVWKTINNVSGKIVDATADTIKIVKVLDVMGDMAGDAGDDYNGDVVNNQSHNLGPGTGPVTTTYPVAEADTVSGEVK